MVEENMQPFEEVKEVFDFETGDLIKTKGNVKSKVRLRGMKIDNYMDNVKDFYDTQPYFYDKSGIFWFWQYDESKWDLVDDIEVMNALDHNLCFFGQTVSSGVKKNYLEALKRNGRKRKPKEAPKKWIQFKNMALSLKSGEMYDVTPDYFFTNPIPYKIGDSDETPVMDKLFEEWVGKSYTKTLYEIIAYCTYTDYPIQLIFCLCGSGRNGKTCFQRLLNRFLGKENICSTELDVLLNSRFESFKLYKKLVCSMGETNFGVLSKTSLLKKLVGGDSIGFEKKNKDPFDDFNYAKVMISSNSLPSSNDTSEGFYRRWLIIDFPNEFPEGKDILKTIPDEEYNNLANKVIKILPELLKTGQFTNQGEIAERKNKYMMASNPLPLFLEACCDKREETFISYNELYTAYVKYLRCNKKRKVNMKEFRSALEDEGFWIERTTKSVDEQIFKSGNWINGLELKYDWNDRIYVNNVKKQEIPTQLPYTRERVRKGYINT